MKQQILKTLAILSISIQANAQSIPATADLDINNIRATIACVPTMFTNNTSNAAYEFPKGSGKTAMYSSGLWIGGFASDNGSLKVAASSYGVVPKRDFWAGPLNTNGQADTNGYYKWNKVWKVNKSEIDAFKNLCGTLTGANLQTYLLSNYTLIPISIIDWPAKGSITAVGSNNSLLSITKDMAPFIDVNGDGIYSVLSGDYPQIKGDQALWWVFNDMGGAKTNSQTDGMELEIQAMAYACATSDVMNDVTFYNYKIFNLSNTTYDSCIIGNFNDIDLGNYVDDYIGFDVSRNLAIGYNGDSLDDGANGYGTNLTQVGIKICKTWLSDSLAGTAIPVQTAMWYNNGNGPQGNPTFGLEYYKYLTAHWKDGVPLSASCDGRTGATINTLYPSDPSVIGGSSEKACNNLPGDRKLVINSAPFSFKSGRYVVQDFAVLNSALGSSNANFTAIQNVADQAQAAFNANGCGSFAASTPKVKLLDGISLYPNPTSNYMQIKFKNADEKIESISIQNTYGQESTLPFLNNTVNLQQVSAGMYIFKVRTNKGLYVQKVAKQ